MINKRLLIKNLLAHHDENSFYDKKRFINISEKEGKAKFLKHVCALANSNPENNSFILVGVEDEDNRIVGVDFFDDSKIQNLVNAYLTNAPLISYENIHFPQLPTGKVVGLVTISSSGELCSLRKNIWKYYGGSVFFREGSISKPRVFDTDLVSHNENVVATIEKNAANNIEYTLNGVIEFLYHSHDNLISDYKVFKEQFVVCWAGKSKVVNDRTYYSRVDIELINEQVKLFYSDLDEVEITYNDNEFKILEYLKLGLKNQQRYYPLEEVVIHFRDNGNYHIKNKLVFEPPQFELEILHNLYYGNLKLLQEIESEKTLNLLEKERLEFLPDSLLICYLNGFEDALIHLEKAKPKLKSYDRNIYNSVKAVERIMRKIKYS